MRVEHTPQRASSRSWVQGDEGADSLTPTFEVAEAEGEAMPAPRAQPPRQVDPGESDPIVGDEPLESAPIIGGLGLASSGSGAGPPERSYSVGPVGGRGWGLSSRHALPHGSWYGRARRSIVRRSLHPPDRAGIRRVIRSALPALQACYESALASAPELEGRAVARITVLSTTATVSGVEFPEATALSEVVGGCVRASLVRLDFRGVELGAQPGGVLVIRYPFVFRPRAEPGAPTPHPPTD